MKGIKGVEADEEGVRGSNSPGVKAKGVLFWEDLYFSEFGVRYFDRRYCQGSIFYLYCCGESLHFAMAPKIAWLQVDRSQCRCSP